jgi:hypothetical protein
MKISTAAAAALLLACTAVSAVAQGLPAPNSEISTYVTAGYTYVDGGAFAEFGVATARFGVKSGYVGAEVETGFGVAGSNNSGIKTSLRYTVSGYVVGTLPITERAQLLARAGYGTTRVKASAGGFSISDNVESFNFGGGAIVSFTEQDHLRAEYTRYDTEGAGGADSFSIAYVRKF